MPASPPALVLPFPPHRLPAMMTRLTTYLLQHQYEFLQTYHDAHHMEFDILVQPDRPAVRLVLQAGETPAPSPESLAAQQPSFPKPVLVMLQHLLRPPASPGQSLYA